MSSKLNPSGVRPNKPVPTFKAPKTPIKSMQSHYVATFADSDTPHCHTTQSGARLARERPEARKKLQETALYKPLGSIFNDIITHFYNIPGKEITRAAVLTHKKRLFHTGDIEDGKPPLDSQPDFTFTAIGPAFKNPERNLLQGNYDCAAGLVDAKVEGGINQEQDFKQLAVYARQIFSHQPHRRFVRALIVTEEHVRLYHFDRSGAQYSPLINIHEDPLTFVRLVLGVSSVDEETLGFDTSVYWGKDEEGNPTRFIKVPLGKEVDVYQLIPGKEPFMRTSIRGRGTVGWYVFKGDKQFLIKDSWRSTQRQAEHEFLEAAKGIDGIGQMVSYVEGPHIREFRGTEVDSYEKFRDRVFCRIILDLYGGSIDTFETVEQVLAAVRDAIAGHRALLHQGVLHRDVSIHNILLGVVGILGKRGLLIDLDMAKFVTNGGANALTDFRTGTRMFQSLMVLESFTLENYAPQHDHLDDLESFLYVLMYLFWTFETAGVPKPSLPKWMEEWAHDYPHRAFLAKRNVMLVPRLHAGFTNQISSFWGEPCRDLMRKFHKIVSGVASEKSEIANVAQSTSEAGDYDYLRYNEDGSPKYYDDILKLLDDAIEGVRAEAAAQAQADNAEEDHECVLGAAASTSPAPSEASSDDQERAEIKSGTPVHLGGDRPKSHTNKRNSEADYAHPDRLGPSVKRLRTLSGTSATPVLSEDKEEERQCEGAK